MKSKFSVDGHPLHPALVALPIGLFIWAFAADVLYLATGKDRVWYDISFYTAIGAIVTALFASLPGLGDYFTMTMNAGQRLVATLHMLFNFAVVGLYFVAMLIAWDHGATRGTELGMVFVLHLVGVGLLTVSGWLGGHMAYVYHFAMVPEGESQRLPVIPGTDIQPSEGPRGGGHMQPR